jgi:hypothetical protein
MQVDGGYVVIGADDKERPATSSEGAKYSVWWGWSPWLSSRRVLNGHPTK